jgi:hypothetical protein
MKLILFTSLATVLEDTRIIRQYYVETRGNPFSDEKSAYSMFTEILKSDPVTGRFMITPQELVVTVGSSTDIQQHYVVAK